jgi:hypothetical protein
VEAHIYNFGLDANLQSTANGEDIIFSEKTTTFIDNVVVLQRNSSRIVAQQKKFLNVILHYVHMPSYNP